MKINLVSRDREIVYNWDGFTVCRDLNVDNYRYLKLVEANIPDYYCLRLHQPAPIYDS